MDLDRLKAIAEAKLLPDATPSSIPFTALTKAQQRAVLKLVQDQRSAMFDGTEAKYARGPHGKDAEVKVMRGNQVLAKYLVTGRGKTTRRDDLLFHWK